MSPDRPEGPEQQGSASPACPLEGTPRTGPDDGAPGPDGTAQEAGRDDDQDTATHAATERARAVGRGLGTGARATAQGTAKSARGVARVAGRASRFTVGQARRAARAEGADESGLSRLIEMHAFNTAGDAAVVVGMAGTLFFQVPTGEARGQVALFLGLTMLPFLIVAPLIGPFLDRFSHGRRWAIGATMALRAFLCWVLAAAVTTDSALLFPAALGVLVASKAYGVTRAAAVPRLLPSSLTLVKANGRVSLAGMIGAAASTPFAVLAAYFGSQWALRYAFVLFVIATVLAILLPAKVDASEGERSLIMRDDADGTDNQGRRGTRIPSAVAFALRANCGPRFLSGFLTMFMAFLLRENPIDGWESRPELLLGLVIGGAALGNGLGILTASLVKRIDPAVMVVAALVADTAIVLLGALFYGVPTLFGLGLVAGLAQSLGKVSLDSTIQQGVPTQVQASAFARSDTTLQLAWVVGGFVGIALPLIPRLGLGVACAALGAWAFFVISTRPRRGHPTNAPGPI